MSRQAERNRAARAVADVLGAEVCPEVAVVQGRLRALAGSGDVSPHGAMVLLELADDLQTARQTTARLRIALEGLLVTEAGHPCPCDGDARRGHHPRCYVWRLREAMGVRRRRTLAREIAEVVIDLTPTAADDVVLKVLDVLRGQRRRRQERPKGPFRVEPAYRSALGVEPTWEEPAMDDLTAPGLARQQEE